MARGGGAIGQRASAGRRSGRAARTGGRKTGRADAVAERSGADAVAEMGEAASEMERGDILF